MTELTISKENLEARFCDKSYCRMSGPFFHEGFAHYTDGRILAWRESEPFEHGEFRIPSTNSLRGLRGKHNQELQWQVIPEVDCTTCHFIHHGKVFNQTCDDCSGSGREFCASCEHDWVCETCDGEGILAETTCFECSERMIDISGVKIGLEFIAKIYDLPNIEVAVVCGEMVAFRSGEILGLIMARVPRQ